MAPTAKANVLVLQSGGPTAVHNQSLAGVVEEALEQDAFDGVFGAINGLAGLVTGTFLDLGHLPRSTWRKIAQTPGSALGSGRRRPTAEDIPRALDVLIQQNISFLFAIGGNDSAAVSHSLSLAAQERGQPLKVVCVPKTVDNDLQETDHSPGYGSAARFVALATLGAGMDAESMGKVSPITVLELMGRNSGWIVAASTLGKREARDPPHVVCPPEITFDEVRFITQVEEAYRRWGYAIAVVSENLRHPNGRVGHDARHPIHVDPFGHEYYQSPGQYLAERLGSQLKVRVRYEKPGTIQRSLVACTSVVDAAEANLVGRQAVRVAMTGLTDVMVTLVRDPSPIYSCSTGVARLDRVAGSERYLPPAFLDEHLGLPTSAFTNYARPLIGGRLPRFARLK
ncbi:diphosphate--fructose-6-phosphate 1-phosphotransferase [Dehalococcoidia bacterium]|nr:diphosphate--fructose-6-phosphate 1-phosphotransferase [Dehalococcoidia bacterium]MCL0101600.1 diphosphate--fructose-6-phosphate 1-phosphotransferase [Dehalococcoidia bacterium]